MNVAVFSTKPYDEEFLKKFNGSFGHRLVFIENKLTLETAGLAAGFPAVCAFVNDGLDRPVLEALQKAGTRFIAMRCAGFNNVDLAAAAALGLKVVRVPAYSPHAVAEHAVAMLLTLNRRTHKAYNRVRDGNFSIDGLMGHDMFGKTVGVIGTGIIGAVFAGIMTGFGCEVIAYDVTKNPQCEKAGVKYVSLDELFERSHFISVHCPLLPETYHLLNAQTFARMREGVFIVNTSRGAIIDAEAASEAVKSGRIGGLALDVYEEEGVLFFEDLSFRIIQDDVFMRLTTFPNVLVTSHQAFFTHEAMANIATTTLANLADLEAGRVCRNLVELPLSAVGQK